MSSLVRTYGWHLVDDAVAKARCLAPGRGSRRRHGLFFASSVPRLKCRRSKTEPGFSQISPYILNATQNQHFTHDPHGQQTQKIAIKSDFRVSTKFCTKYCVVCGILNENTPVSALILWTLAVCITVCCSAHAYTSITVTVAATVTA